MSRFTFLAVLATVALSATAERARAQTDEFFAGDGSALSAAKWGTSASGPFTSNFTNGNNAIFAITNGTGTGASITVAGITATENFTLTAISGTITNQGNGIVTIDVASGKTLDFSTQAFTNAATAGYIKNGSGVLALAGNTYAGGFTLNSGTVILRGADALGSSPTTNPLTLNGGIVAANATRDLTGKYTGGITIGGNVQFGDTTGLASGAATLTFSNDVSLGGSLRTLTLGSSTGNTVFGGVISNTGSGGITFAATSGVTTGSFQITNTANTFTGPITITGGEVRFSGANSFGNANNSITVDGGRLTFAGTYTLATTHNIFVGDAAGTTISAVGGNVTYGGVIADKSGVTGSWTKEGASTLILTGANTYTGTTTISAGTLQIGAGATGTLGAGAVTNNGILIINRTGTMTVANDIGGSGALTFSGAGTITLSGTNTYTGVTTLTAGTVSVATIGNGGVAGNLGQATSAATNLVFNGTAGAGILQYTGGDASTDRNFTINTGRTATFNITTNTLTLSGTSTATNGALTKTGNGTLVLTGSNPHTGLNTVSAGTLVLGHATNTLTGAVTVSGTGTLSIGSNSDTVGAVIVSVTGSGGITGTSGVLTGTSYTFSNSGAASVTAILGGTGALSQTGTGTTTLSGTNTYTGVTTLTAGTLSVGTIGNGGVASNLGQASSAATNLVFNGTAGAGILQYAGGDASTDRNFTINTGRVATFDITSNTLTLSGASTVSTGALTKLGNGTLTLTGTNLHTGTNTVTDGTLVLGHATNTLSDVGAVTVNGGTLAIGSNSDTVGVVTVSAGGITGTSGVLTGVSYSFTNTSANPVSVSAILGGTGGLTKSNTGTVTLSGANTYTGVTTLTAGVVSVDTIGNGGTAGNIGAASSLAANLLFDGGTLLYTGATASTDRSFTIIAGKVATINIAANTLTMSGSSTATTGALTKAGNGTLVLTGTNLHTGANIVSGGTLVAANASGSATGSGNITINSGATLRYGGGGSAGSVSGVITNNGTLVFDRSDDLTYSGVIGGSGLVNKANSNTLTLSGVNTYTGGTTISAGTLVVTNASGSATGSGAITISSDTTLRIGVAGTAGAVTGAITNNGTLVFDRSDAISYGGLISGSGVVTKLGSSTVTLSGANTYSGGTTISAGTLIVTNGSANGTGTGTVTIANGATLQVGAGAAGGSIGGDISNSGAVVVDRPTGGPWVYTGTITGNGSVTINASRGLTLGNGTTTGFVDRNITNNGTLTFNRSNAVTYQHVVSGSGSLVQAGAGTLTLTGANTYTGGTTVNANRTLQIGNGGTVGSIVGNLAVNGIVQFNHSDDVTFGGVISGAPAGMEVRQIGTGALYLTGTNTYSGSTFVDQGTLGGTGTMAGATSFVATGARIRGGISGSSPTGTLNFTGWVTLNDNAILQVEATRTGAGTANASLLNGSATLSQLKLNPSAETAPGAGDGDKFIIDIVSRLSNPNPLEQGESYTITIGRVTTGGLITLNGTNLFVTGDHADDLVDVNSVVIFDAVTGDIHSSQYTLQSSDFGSFSGVTLKIANTDRDLVLTFTPAPEPGAVLAIAVGALAIGGLIRRRFRKPTDSLPTA